MSLINEALKEARHEATRQDAIRQGGLYPRLPFHGPPATRRQRWWIAIVVVILAGVSAGWWWRTTASSNADHVPEVAVTGPIDSPSHSDTNLPTPRSSPPAATTEVSPAVDAGRPDSTATDTPARGSDPPAHSAPMPEPVTRVATAPPIDTAPANDSVPTIDPAPTAPSPAPGEAETSAEPVVAGDTTAVAAQASPLPEAPQTPYVPDATAVPADPVSFRRAARLKDGTRLSLGGIAWSPSQPVALINGRVMAVGEITEGFVLKEVKRDYVYLKRRDQVVILTLE